MVAYGSLHSHKDADLEKGGKQVAAMFKDALNTIPYLTAGASESNVNSERMAAVQKYKKLMGKK